MNAPEYNFFGYRIFSNVTLHGSEATTAEFMYRGFEVVLSTYKPGGQKVAVLQGDHIHGEYASVELAVAAIDEVREMQSSGARRFTPIRRTQNTNH